MITMDDFMQTLIHYKIAIVLLVLIIIFCLRKDQSHRSKQSSKVPD